MTELTNFTFQLNNIEYYIVIISKISADGYNLNFEVTLKEKSNDRIIFQTICGDWVSVKDIIDSYFYRMGEMVGVDPNTVERARDGFLKN
jgi:hypothetical protein